MADNSKNTNGYSETNSRIKTIRYTVVAILIIFVALALFFFREELTLENLRYLMKYVDVEPMTFGSNENTQISFESDSATVTASFKKDLVVLTKSSLKIYDLSSKEILDSSHSLNNPALSVGERYFAVYDMGGKYVAVYNSFAKLWENTFDYPVYDVSLDADGNFCVATGEADHTSALRVYNSSFKEIFKWSSIDKYSLCADIHSDDGISMVAGTLKSTDKGDMLSEIVIFSADSEKVAATVDLLSEMVVATRFNSEGNIVCLTDCALRVISQKGEILSERRFDSKALRKFEVSGDKTVLLLNENLVGKNHAVIILDAKGNTYMESTVDSEITDLCLSDSYAFLLGVDDITVIDLEKKDAVVHDSERSYRAIELIDSSNVYLVYDGAALALGVEK